MDRQMTAYFDYCHRSFRRLVVLVILSISICACQESSQPNSPESQAKRLLPYPIRLGAGPPEPAYHYIIAPSGKRAFDFTYDDARHFRSKVAVVEIGGYLGVINLNGEYVLTPSMSHIEDFSDGIAAAQIPETGKCGIIDVSGEWVVPAQYDRAAVRFPDLIRTEPITHILAMANGKWGFVNRSGDWVIEPQFEQAWSFSDGLAMVLITDTSLGKSRFVAITKSGDRAFQDEYMNALPYSEGRAWVYRLGDVGWTIIDTAGKQIGGQAYSSPTYFSDGYANAMLGDNLYILDVDGNTTARLSASGNQMLSCGLAGFEDVKTEKWGYVNQEGSIVIHPKYRNVEPFRNGFSRVETEHGMALIDMTGQVAYGPEKKLP